MGKQITDEELIKHKKSAIKKVNNVLEVFLNSHNPKHKKKADLISYWLESYSQYLLNEEKFDYTTIPRYKRGDIISVNFGFNVGSEHGGLHYAIVLDNDNRQSSPVITVIPLSSGKEVDTYERDVYLGNELYEKLNAKYNKLNAQINEDLNNLCKTISVLAKSADTLAEDSEANLQKDVEELLAELRVRVETLNREKAMLKTYEKKLLKLKEGSIALMEQITTISKMRIYEPKNSSDLLYDIKFSDGAMDKINVQLKKLFVYSK
ncbi:MAG: type II toxin-antitoxin system PemK/MazF family toxin [Lachnospiraceae bacterium]